MDPGRRVESSSQFLFNCQGCVSQVGEVDRQSQHAMSARSLICFWCSTMSSVVLADPSGPSAEFAGAGEERPCKSTVWAEKAGL